MMLNITCARGSEGMLPLKIFDKNGAILCILSLPKSVIINLKINIFLITNNPNFVQYFFSKINPDAPFGTNINTFTFYKGVVGQ